MKKVVLTVLAAATALAVCSCGKPEKNGKSNGGGSTVSTTKATYGTRQVYELETAISGKYDSLTKLTGSYIESIDGEKVNYIFINTIGNTVYKIGSKSPMPIGIVTSEAGIMVYRGNKTPADSFVPYTFDGKVLSYTDSEGAHIWQKVDKVDIDGNYYLISDGRVVGSWTFDAAKKRVDINHGETQGTFTQTADKLVIKQDDGTTTEYSYVFDLLSLELTNGSDKMEFRAV